MNQRTLEEIAGLAHGAQQREIEKLSRSVEALRQKVRELVKNAAKEEAASPARPVFEDRNVAASPSEPSFGEVKTFVDLVALRDDDCKELMSKYALPGLAALKDAWNRGFDHAGRLYEKLRQMERKDGGPSGG